MQIAKLAGYLLAIGTALWSTQVRFYHRYTFNATRSQAELAAMFRRTVGWLRLANVLFALATVLLAALLIVIVWQV